MKRPITGPIDIPSVVESEKYPTPSPLFAEGTISTAMVDPEMVVTPQVSPCRKRRIIKVVIVSATRYPAKNIV